MATHSSILAWRITTDRGARWATVYGVQSWIQLSKQPYDVYSTGNGLVPA